MVMVALGCAAFIALPQLAYAAAPLTLESSVPSVKQSSAASQNNGDILLGLFNYGDESPANRIYASYDGYSMLQIASTFKGAGLNKPYSTYCGSHYAQTCPSIIYHNGYFWSISGWQRKNGKIWPVISYSPDLVRWTHPEGNAKITGTRGIPVDKYPVVNGKTYKNFDIVAPEWGRGSDGSLYIIVSCGYFGAFHGRPGKDQMTAYTVRVKELSCGGLGARADGNYYWTKNLVFKTEKAKRLNLGKGDYIDGAMFADGKTTYLAVKRNGVINQLFKSKTPNKPSSWKMVNKELTLGYEAPSITKFNGKYYLFTDHLANGSADGVHVSINNKMTGTWQVPQEFPFITGKKAHYVRHGSVITLKKGTKPWKIAKKLLDKQLKKYGSVVKKASKKNKALRVSADKYGTPFLVQVSTKKIAIRKGPGTNYAATGKYAAPGIYTIMEVKKGPGSSAGWGRLKSGLGWVSLDVAKRRAVTK